MDRYHTHKTEARRFGSGLSYAWVIVFAIAMGFLESAVVVYLREILYPGGFHFPLASMDLRLARVEFFRELATLVMLAGAGILAGRTVTTRFAWFLFAFAIWDIFYYIFLKLLLNWPESLLTWDVLFLVPVTWTGPVLSPLIASMLMILFSVLIIRSSGFSRLVFIHLREWFFLLSGALVVFLSFVWDYSVFILHHYSLGEIWSLRGSKALFGLSLKYVPVHFPWILFAIGCSLILIAILLFAGRNRR